jgi:hypothetical protein
VRTPQNVFGILVAALTLTACGATPAPKATPSARPSTAAPSPTPSPTPAAGPTKAADGRNYRVCASRSCEVAITGPVKIRFGGSVPGRLSIKKVSADGVDFDVSLSDGSSGNGTLKGGCSAFSFGGGGGFGTFGGDNSNCATGLPQARPGSVTLQVPTLRGGTAIMRIVTG